MKIKSDKRVMSYRHKVIYRNEYAFKVAIKNDGTDTYFATLTDAMNAIDELLDKKES